MSKRFPYIVQLRRDGVAFPPPEYALHNGLLASGGTLRTDRLLNAYMNGIFPWYNEGMPIRWWCPHIRFIIRPENIHVSKSMKKFMRLHDVSATVNGDFADTIHRCRVTREFNEGTWITDAMESAYKMLNRMGYAMSVESYIDGERAGGLYGVVIGKCFFGESMYSSAENGSKIALIKLAEKLSAEGFLMIDCQFHTDHLASMGGEEISWEEYRKLLDEGIEEAVRGSELLSYVRKRAMAEQLPL